MEHNDLPYYPPSDTFVQVLLLAALALSVIVLLSLASALDVLSEPARVTKNESPAGSFEELSRRLERQKQEMDLLRSRISTENSLATEETVRLVALYIAGVVFVVWIYKTRRGLAQLGVGSPKYSSPFVIALLILPIVNLFVLFPFVRQVWGVTHNTLEPPTPVNRRPKALIPIWEASVALALLTVPAPFYFIAAVPKPSHHLALVYYVACGVALVLTLLLVRRVTCRHEEIAVSMAGSG